MEKIVIIDGHNLLFRMFYGIPSAIKNSKGKDIRGLVGFIGSLKKIIDEFKPHSVVVVFDSETSRNKNSEIDNNYKSNRIDYTDVIEEENPFTQLPLIMQALDYLNIQYLEVENYEADDFIASIVSNSSYQYIIVSTDSDFIQLINENTYLYVPRGKNSILYDENTIIEKYNITPSKYIMFKSLVGDTSDNIKGIKGIGSITASKILKYSSPQEFISNNPTSRFSKILIENKDILVKNNNLIKMNTTLDTSSIKFKPLSNTITEYNTYEIIEKIGQK